MRGLGDLSTEKRINRLRHGLERCIVYLVNQSDSVPERAGEYKHQITLTKRQDKRSYSALASKLQTPKLPETLIDIINTSG